MPKKFKVKTYEKDNDDHYVVVLNPWAKGGKQRSQQQIDWMGAWLRIAFWKPQEKHIVKNIYSVETRSEVIARVSASVDVRLGLGLHRWAEFMKEDYLETIRQSGVDLSGNISYIFPYNWTLHGDPAERQWREWFPRQDEIPPNIMIKMDYPEPEWTEIPSVDSRLRSLLLPLPTPVLDFDLDAIQSPVLEGAGTLSSVTENESDALYSKDEEANPTKNEERIDGIQTNSGRAIAPDPFSSYRSPLHLPGRPQTELSTGPSESIHSSSKADKLDPYEEDDKARALLSTAPVKREILDCVKSEAEDIKPCVQNTGYRPSQSLSNAISGLRKRRYSGGSEHKPTAKIEEEQDVKPDVRSAGYRPSDSLARAVSQLRGETAPLEEEDRKPFIKKEEYNPSSALHDALSRYSEILPSDESGNGNLKLLSMKEDAESSAANASFSETRTVKRCRTDRVLV